MKIGKIELHSQSVRIDYVMLGEVLAFIRFVPFRVQHLSYKEVYEFIGYSPAFEDQDEFAVTTEYVLEIVVDEERKLTEVKVIKVAQNGN